jgi:hypothetical protein
VAMFSAVMISTAFAGSTNATNGFLNSGNINTCSNAGAGNGGEFVNAFHCGVPLPTEAGDADPGNSGANNNAPPLPPGR